MSQLPIMHTDGCSEGKENASTQSQAQGSTGPVLGLSMGGPMSGSADPYWQRLSDLIVQGGVAAENADELRQVFAVEHQDRWRGHVPAYLLTGALLIHCVGISLPPGSACGLSGLACTGLTAGTARRHRQGVHAHG